MFIQSNFWLFLNKKLSFEFYKKAEKDLSQTRFFYHHYETENFYSVDLKKKSGSLNYTNLNCRKYMSNVHCTLSIIMKSYVPMSLCTLSNYEKLCKCTYEPLFFKCISLGLYSCVKKLYFVILR